MGSIAGLLALFAFTRKAKASTPNRGVPAITKAECDTAKGNRASVQQSINEIDKDINTASANMSASANAGDEEQLAYWTSVRSQLQGIRAQAVASRNNIDAFLEQCD